jgi:hypothetical protein
MSNMREQAKHATRVGTESLIVVAGGGFAGALQSKMPYLPGTQIPTAAAVGVGLITMAMSGMLDDQADNAAFLGAGMLAALAAKETEKLLLAA